MAVIVPAGATTFGAVGGGGSSAGAGCGVTAASADVALSPVALWAVVQPVTAAAVPAAPVVRRVGLRR